MKIYGILWTEIVDNQVIVWQSNWAFKYVSTAENHIKEMKEDNENLKGKVIEMKLAELPY